MDAHEHCFCTPIRVGQNGATVMGYACCRCGEYQSTTASSNETVNQWPAYNVA